MRTATAICCAALAALPACSCDTVPSNAVQSCDALQVQPDKVLTDILFVVDDSGSMTEEQANLAANLGAFIDTLAASPIQNDFRVAVTNTSVEEYGATATRGQTYPRGPAAGKPYPHGAILAIAQSGGVGISGDLIYDTGLYPQTGGWGGNRYLDAGMISLQQDFKANVLVGIQGSGREQPFRAAQLALTDRLADANGAFLRPGARLAIIFLSDEDDCSGPASASVGSNTQCHDPAVKDDPALITGIPDFVAFLDGAIGGEQRDVTVGAIAGLSPVTLEPSCGDASICANLDCATAMDKGDRFAQLMTALGPNRMRLGSICDPSFQETLVQFAQVLMPTSMPLKGTPADWRMLAVKLTRATGEVIACRVALQGTPEATTADAVYAPPAAGEPAEITFYNACQLGLGDRIDVAVVCAG
jgi:hypothetical protein